MVKEPLSRDVARAIFRYVDDPDQFERIRLKVLQSDALVTLVPDLRDPDTGRRVTRPKRSAFNSTHEPAAPVSRSRIPTSRTTL